MLALYYYDHLYSKTLYQIMEWNLDGTPKGFPWQLTHNIFKIVECKVIYSRYVPSFSLIKITFPAQEKLSLFPQKYEH